MTKEKKKNEKKYNVWKMTINGSIRIDKMIVRWCKTHQTYSHDIFL